MSETKKLIKKIVKAVNSKAHIVDVLNMVDRFDVDNLFVESVEFSEDINGLRIKFGVFLPRIEFIEEGSKE